MGPIRCSEIIYSQSLILIFTYVNITPSIHKLTFISCKKVVVIQNNFRHDCFIVGVEAGIVRHPVTPYATMAIKFRAKGFIHSCLFKNCIKIIKLEIYMSKRHLVLAHIFTFGGLLQTNNMK